MPKQKKIKPLRKYINIFENLVKNEYKKKIAMTDIAFKKKIKGY